MQKNYFQLLLIFYFLIHYSTSQEASKNQNTSESLVHSNNTENKIVTKEIIERTENVTESGPTVITKRTVVYQDKNGKPISVTKINISKGNKNLNSNENRQTPIAMLGDIDKFFNNFFENVVIGTRLDSIFESIQKEHEEFIKSVFEDEWKEEKEAEKLMLENKKENKENVESKPEDKEKLKKEKMEKYKKRFKVIPKNITKKELIFSRVCKYVFYSIILFVLYIIVRRFLIVLDIIDPESDIFGGKKRRLAKLKEEEEMKLKEKSKVQEIKSAENKQQ